MIDSRKDHGGRSSYESLKLDRTTSHLLHDLSTRSYEDPFRTTKTLCLSNAHTIYGPSRSLDIITYASTSSRKISAAIVEHNPTGRSYIHCCSAKEDTRTAAVEHLLVITEDLLQRLCEREGIGSCGWLPATPQSQHASTYGSTPSLSRMVPEQMSSQGLGSIASQRSSPVVSAGPPIVPAPRPTRAERVEWIMGSEG